MSETPAADPVRRGNTGSLSRRMLLIATAWVSILLVVGGLALDRTLVGLVTRNFDDQLGYMLTAMIASAEIDPGGEVWFSRPLGDQRFLEPNSGLYWQISGQGHEDFPSRSLWDRSLKLRYDHTDETPHVYDSDQFPGERLRIVERSIYLPNSGTRWWFAVAESRASLDQQIREIRSILIRSFALLAAGLFVLSALQIYYGLRPLRRIRLAIAKVRTGGTARLTEPLPQELEPMVQEINALLDHTEKQAEEARTHAGNLAHALKTPLTVLLNAGRAHEPHLSETIEREAGVMRRQVDHHLARARAVGRRSSAFARANVWDSTEAVERAVGTLYPAVRFDIDGQKDAIVALERQDLDEIMGNLIENAAKYGSGSVFVTIDAEPGSQDCVVWIEDDGLGISENDRDRLFDRGARLDTNKPGTGLGLAIVRDVVEIYGGSVALTESEDLGGLMVVLNLPRAQLGSS